MTSPIQWYVRSGPFTSFEWMKHDLIPMGDSRPSRECLSPVPSLVAQLEQGPASVDAEGEGEVSILHHTSCDIDPEHSQPSLGHPDPETCAAVEIEAGIRRAVSGRNDFGDVEEDAGSDDEGSVAIEGAVAGQARMNDLAADSPPARNPPPVGAWARSGMVQERAPPATGQVPSGA